MNQHQSTSTNVNRRQAIIATGAALTAPLYVPQSAFGANERLDIGVIGVDGRGRANLSAMAKENVVALCDVDQNRLGGAKKRFTAAKPYQDYRKLLENEKLDAVVISTPDHHHAPATVRALHQGFHVYCEKPLTHTVAEARHIAKLTAKKKLATQMGTQNHEHPGYVQLVEWLESGVIGQVSEVHVITDRPGRWWPQGMSRPGQTEKIPAHIDWDVWLGPAPQRPYHSAYVPFKWRGWWDFGCGAVGDMAIHLMDPAFWALKLGGPVKVTSHGPPANSESGPTWMHTVFEFAQRGKLAPVKVHWYEGIAKPAAEIAKDLPMNGSLFIGEHGKIAVTHGKSPKVLGAKQDLNYPKPYLPKSPGHHQQWIEACKTGSRTGSNFGYAAPFTEIVLLGNVAYRTGQTIAYDPAEMKVTNVPEANGLLTKKYRNGWEALI